MFLNFGRDYQPLNRIEVSKASLLHNYAYLSSLKSIAPVLKSNAYGHGIIEVAKILDNLKAPYFCVDSLYEAYQLLKAKIKTPILIMGYTDPQNLKIKKLPFSYAVFDLQTVKVLDQFQAGCGVHIFVDTGMNREGIKIEDLADFLQYLKSYSYLKIEGLMSHLSCADNKKDPLNLLQIKNFQKAIKITKHYGFNPKWIHLANSDGLLNQLPTSEVGIQNMARVGLALYGISTNPNLKPILTLKSKIIQIKKLQKGDRIGYGGTFKVKKPMFLGVLPIGYYDGIDRRLSNKGWVLIDDIPCRILGRVSMNITTVDISKVPNPKIGEEVLIYSNNPKDPNSLGKTAKHCKTIPYELLVHLAGTTRRVII